MTYQASKPDATLLRLDSLRRKNKHQNPRPQTSPPQGSKQPKTGKNHGSSHINAVLSALSRQRLLPRVISKGWCLGPRLPTSLDLKRPAVAARQAGHSRCGLFGALVVFGGGSLSCGWQEHVAKRVEKRTQSQVLAVNVPSVAEKGQPCALRVRSVGFPGFGSVHTVPPKIHTRRTSRDLANIF